ncbi:MAG: YhfC family intramembrane metalloprotease [Chloroflexi bacterium]|nr:YhfC family intramembrane metalloprotease [Chloroflexota bacterium]
MVTVLLALNFLLMLILPILLGRLIAARRRVGWGLFGIGAVTFILSQVAHIPFNWLILQQLKWVDTDNLPILALFLGLSAGTFEETARYLSYRFWAKDARSWGQGLMLGIGHGGIEAILLGVIGLINFTVLLGLKNGYFAGILATVPEDQLYLADEQINALFSVPASMALLGATERVYALMLHLSASLLVLQVFVRGQLRWLGAAIVWHAVIDTAVVYIVFTWGAVETEIVLGLLSFISVGLIFWLHQPEPVEKSLEPLPELVPLEPVETTTESLSSSKYFR